MHEVPPTAVYLACSVPRRPRRIQRRPSLHDSKAACRGQLLMAVRRYLKSAPVLLDLDDCLRQPRLSSQRAHIDPELPSAAAD